MSIENFSVQEVMAVWDLVRGKCEVCGKILDPKKIGSEEEGGWNAYNGENQIPIILCSEDNLSCYPYFIKNEIKIFSIKGAC